MYDVVTGEKCDSFDVTTRLKCYLDHTIVVYLEFMNELQFRLRNDSAKFSS